MSQDITEAHALVKAAESAASTSKKQFLFFSGSPDYLEASELYNKAAIIFKNCKEWKEAGDAFRKSDEMETKTGERDESGRKLINAVSCYKKCDPQAAVETLEVALDILLRSGRFHIAANHEKEMAEIYELQLEDLKNAIKYYERASERYAGEDSQATAQTCSLKAASLAALSGEYEKAAMLYEEAASASVADPIRKYSVKDNLLRAGLCRLCGEDRIAARRSLEGYPSIDVSFGNAKEFKLLADIMEAIEKDEVETFTSIISTFDRTNPLDDWKTKILLRIKQGITEAEDDLT